jgi:hypothetical protein
MSPTQAAVAVARGTAVAAVAAFVLLVGVLLFVPPSSVLAQLAAGALLLVPLVRTVLVIVVDERRPVRGLAVAVSAVLLGVFVSVAVVDRAAAALDEAALDGQKAEEKATDAALRPSLAAG